MSTSSPHDSFAVVRRGYEPAQVDDRVLGLQKERDAARERAAELTLLAERLTEESARLGKAVTALQPDTHAQLGDRAQELLATVEEEAEAVRDTGERDAQNVTDRARADAGALRGDAHAAAADTRKAAEAAAERVLAGARAQAEHILGAARTDAGATRDEAAETLRDTSDRCAALLAAQEKDHTAAHEALTREIEERENTLETRLTDLDTRAARALDQARRAHAQAEEAARHRQEDAEAQAADILAQAGARETHTERETERLLHEHEEVAAELNAHMARVRSTLAALTGKTEPDPATTLPRQPARPDN